MSSRSYRRVLVKISGECFSQSSLLTAIVRQLVAVQKRRVAVAVVVGGGNIVRGRDLTVGDSRVTLDKAGMLATVINGLQLAEQLGQKVPVEHLCAFPIYDLVEGFSLERARHCLDNGSVLVLSGGTGHPFFSTDSAAALRAAELGLEVILKGTWVKGVYSSDPKVDPKARFYRRLTFEQALTERLAVMDLAAFALCREHRIPVVVFDIRRPKAIIDIISGKQIGSLVC